MIGAAAMFFIAYRAYTIGNDVAEMKKALKDLRKSGSSLPALSDAVGTGSHHVAGTLAPGEWPSVTDPAYNRDLPYDFRPSEPRH